MSDNFRFAQLQPFSLAGAGAIIGATSITLKSMTDIDGNALSMATDFGSIGFGTLEPGNGTQEEQISFTGLSNNANGTVTLTGVKNVSFVYPYTETSGLAKTHPGSSIFVISNTSGFYDKLTSKSDDETITGIWSFTSVPNTTQDPVAGDDIARRSWVLSVVNGGNVSMDSVVVSGTAGETIAQGQIIYLKAADGKWYLTDADDSTTCVDVIMGIAQGAGTVDVSISNGILVVGVDTHQTGMTAGAAQYVSNTAGGISSSPGTNSVILGNAKSSTQLYFSPNYTGLVTANQKAALAGNNGTPSGTNKYVTVSGFNVLLAAVTNPVLRVYTSSTTWTKPAGLDYAVIEVVGSGAGGAGSGTADEGGGGGGAGGYSKKIVDVATLGATETVTVGAGGAGGAAGDNDGSNGATSSFGSHASATGGQKGFAFANNGYGGIGGAGSSGTLNLTGGGGGSGSANTTNHLASSGIGGASFLGGGGHGVAGTGGTGSAGGVTGVAYGSGGSGGVKLNGGSDANGGDGAGGVVIVTEYYSS